MVKKTRITQYGCLAENAKNLSLMVPPKTYCGGWG